MFLGLDFRSWTVTGNLAEALCWWLVAVLLVWRSASEPKYRCRTLRVLAGSFTIFGISDVIEVFTGACWKPLGLLLLKGACLVMIFGGWRRYHRLGPR